MTITKQQVEAEIALLKAKASDCHVRTNTVEMLRALLARVEAVTIPQPRNVQVTDPRAESYYRGYCKTCDARAWLLAILKALIDQAQENG